MPMAGGLERKAVPCSTAARTEASALDVDAFCGQRMCLGMSLFVKQASEDVRKLLDEPVCAILGPIAVVLALKLAVLVC